MTPCVMRDGDVGVTDNDLCVGCGFRPANLFHDLAASHDALAGQLETLRAQIHGMQDGSLVRDQQAHIELLAGQVAALYEGLKRAHATTVCGDVFGGPEYPPDCCYIGKLLVASEATADAFVARVREGVLAEVELYGGVFGATGRDIANAIRARRVGETV